DSEEGPINDWDLEDILAARQFGWPIEPKEIEMKQGRWPNGVIQLMNIVRDQVSHLRDYYHPKINRSIVPIVKELYEKNVNPLIYFLWPHSVQEWRAWVPGFTSGMWSSIWRNEQERIEFMKWMGEDLLNNRITEQMEQMIERYPKAEEEGTSDELFVEVMSEIGSDEETPEANVLPASPVYAKAGGQNVENITNPKKFAKVMHNKRQAKEKRIAQEENKAELDKVKSGKFQQPTGNPNDKIKYQRGLGKHGQVLNKALKEGKYVKYLAHMVPTLDEEVALMTTHLINCIYDEAGIEIETIQYYELQFHVLQANLPEKLWNIFELQLAEWTTTRPPWKAYEATAHAYVTMKLRHEFNTRQEGAGNKKDPEPKYTNIQVWKKETDNTDPRIRFWEVIDQKKAHDILEVEKSLKKKIGYRIKHAHNRPAASKVSKQWTRKDSDGQGREKSATSEKERKRKHESPHRDEIRHKKLMSRKRNEERTKKKVGVKKLRTTKKSTKEEKKKRENQKNAKGAESHEVERGHRDITNTMIDWTCPTPVEQFHWIGLEPMKRLNKEYPCPIRTQ
uniref:Uncharacterized protein n=1 Tax=Romanomermis culicivorax TaxID=13658 RepID=A0A915IA33_ROMCU